MALKNTRIGTDQRFALSLSNAGAKVNMNDVEVLHLCMYSNDQRSNDGSISYAVNADDATVLDLLWSAKSQCYLGSHSVHGTIRYAGAVASFDIPAVNVVSLTSEADISTDIIVLEAPVGTEDLTATITIQGMGPQGPKGPKGDKMTYADLTQEDKQELYEGTSEVMKPLLATKQDVLTDTDGSYGQRVAKLEKEGIASQEKLTEFDSKVKDISRDEIQNTEDKIVIQDDNDNDIVTVTRDGLNAKSLKVNNVRVLTQDDKKEIDNSIGEIKTTTKEIEHSEEEGFTDEEIEVQDSLGNTVVKITPDGADFKNIKKKGVEIQTLPATVEETYKKDEEIVFEDSEENPIMKISNRGVKVSNITDMEGNPIAPSYEHPIAITDVIYVAVGRELCIYADSIVKSMDRGLNSPMNYRVLFNCNIGEVHDRFYRLVPTQSQIGEYTFRVRAFDLNNQLVIEKTSTLKVIPNTGFTSKKNIVFISASTGKGTATSLFSHFKNVAGVKPNFVGTQGDAETGKFEAYGGWRFYDFAGAGRPAYRCQVVNVDTIIKGAVYEDAQHHQFTVQETNINADGTGNISLSYISGVTIDNYTTLTIVSGTGDSTVELTTVTIEGNNPLYNVNTAQLDIANYRRTLQLEGKIDIACIQLGVNDANYQMPVAYIERDLEKIYNAFIEDNPNCKVLVTMPLAHGNTIGGTRTNGGSAYDTAIVDDYQWKYRHLFLTKYVNNENFHNLRITCVYPQLDRYYGYDRWEYLLSKYVTEKVTEHSNYWHPNAVGYNQVAEGWLSEILATDL